ncbi:MAG: transglutaminase-like domain-containing protein [Candidatus Woesebacteria bacterium]|nr:transglutaminase-like domain-containing protein [Candidatus Woesebacteria bacterium]
MKKILFLILTIFLFVIFFSKPFIPKVSADGEFATNLETTYKVKENGITEVINKVTLTNLFSNIYATTYSIVLNDINPQNIRGYDEKGPLNASSIKSGTSTTIEIKFNDSLVGKGASRIFWLSFEESSFAVKTGEVWEISIPRLSENANFNNYSLKLLIPESFGQEAYISPNFREKNISNNYFNYLFFKEDVEKTGITAGFGQFQVFSFTLNYHLENPLSRESTTEISLPPDTAFQKIYYQNINPRPTSMQIDSDGNWIAKYKLSSRQRLDVVATGQVQIFASIRSYPKPTEESLNENLIETFFWQTTNPEIVNLAKTYDTPRKIYDFVSTKLKYDYSRVKANVERLGAVKALENPNSAICMEFTDLFIAIARAAGIPAREIDGYAYTENPEIQPLSLVNDVLHAWPEYYDFKSEAWIPVDPTWGSTTGGVDYFNKLDLRHFTFVIHGKNDSIPYAAGSYKLGSNPQKDVFVSFGSLPQERNSKLKIIASLDKFIPLIPNRLNINITNPGPVAVYSLKQRIFFDKNEVPNQNQVEILLPFQIYKSYIDIPFSFLATKTPDKVMLQVDGQEITVSTNKQQVIIYNLLFIFVVSLIILITIVFRLKKWRIFPNLKKLK